MSSVLGSRAFDLGLLAFLTTIFAVGLPTEASAFSPRADLKYPDFDDGTEKTPANGSRLEYESAISRDGETTRLTAVDLIVRYGITDSLEARLAPPLITTTLSGENGDGLESTASRVGLKYGWEGDGPLAWSGFAEFEIPFDNQRRGALSLGGAISHRAELVELLIYGGLRGSGRRPAPNIDGFANISARLRGLDRWGAKAKLYALVQEDYPTDVFAEVGLSRQLLSEVSARIDLGRTISRRSQQEYWAGIGIEWLL